MLNLEETQKIASIYREAFRNLQSRIMPADIEVSFYPYIGINHTIRLRNGKAFVRIAEIFRGAPLEIQDALAHILVAKLLRKRVPETASKIYNEFVTSEEIRHKTLESRKARGRKIITTAQGEFYDLEEIFARLNKIYFQSSLPQTIITWSAQKTFQRLGHHDSTHETIVISKSLDDKKIPTFVVEFVVYHEMLHVKHPTIYRNGRRYNHTPEFYRDEEKFAFYEEAEDWIEQNAYDLRRQVKRQRRLKKK